MNGKNTQEYLILREALIKQKDAEITALRAKVAGLEAATEALQADRDSVRAQLTEAQAKIEAAGKQERKPVSPDWYQCPTTEYWFDHPADANLLEGFVDGVHVGQEFELNVCWSGKQKFRVTKIEDDESDDVELELIESSRELFTAPPIMTAGEPYAWRLIETPPITVPFKRFMTQEQYEAQGPNVKRCYEPFRCANCITAPRGTEKEE